jgi:hypothetical protein
MQKKILPLLCAMMMSSCASRISAVSIYNDLENLASADEQYSGFKDAPVYVQGNYISSFNTVILANDPTGYTLEVEVPADFALRLAGEKVSNISLFFLSLLRCCLNMHFKPYEETSHPISITEILINKASAWDCCKPTYTVRWSGLRSITVYIQDTH